MLVYLLAVAGFIGAVASGLSITHKLGMVLGLLPLGSSPIPVQYLAAFPAVAQAPELMLALSLLLIGLSRMVDLLERR